MVGLILVDKGLILEAKKKLEDRNAFIMADILQLDGFDEKNLKAKCPYHNEDTASFIYNRKNYTFHCFGCQKTVDIIDVLTESGLSFLDAVKYLFEKAEIEYSFGEQNVRTKANYRYPKEEPINAKENVYSYWGRRGISKETIDYLDVREDKNGNTVFNYYDTNDVLTLCKYRPSHTVNKKNGEAKCWCQKDADTSPILFNMNRINTTKPLVICEGEGDLMSIVEAGWTNVVSVPLGCGNMHWVEECWEWLEEFDSIIIWADNDDPGIKMRRDCVSRLGSWRTKYVALPRTMLSDTGKEIPVKDANDVLQVCGAEEIINQIINATDCPVKSVIDYANVEELDISEMEGVESGIKPIDDELLKIFFGTLTIVSGRPASGKTSLVDQIIASTIDNGDPVFLYSKEMPERISTNWFNTIIAGRRNLIKKTARDDRNYYVISPEAKHRMREFYKSLLYIYRDDEPNDVNSIMKAMEECVRKYGVKLLVIDNMMMVDLHCGEENMNSAQTEFINSLINFASKYNVSIILVAHPKKMQDKNSDVAMYDIAGTSNIINLAMRSFGLRRTSEKEKNDPRSKWFGYDVVFTIIKDRLLGKNDIQIGLYYDIRSRRFYSNFKELDHQFKWDTKTYTEPLDISDIKIPQRDEFPDK